MDATHARPMTAYAALCAAAVVVLAQGLNSSTPVADAIAQTGRPAWSYAETVTMAAEQLTDRVRDLSTAVTGASLVPALAAKGEGAARTPEQQQATRAAISSTGSAAAAGQVAKPVTIEPVSHDLRVAVSQVHERASVASKADRASAKDGHKAKRSSAKDVRKAKRAARRR